MPRQNLFLEQFAALLLGSSWWKIGDPVVRVGHSFHKGMLHHVTDTTVSGHFRWQAWGPGLTLVKLIWIDEHVRTFPNAIPKTGSASEEAHP